MYASGAAAEALPPAVGQPLEKARAFLGAHRYPQALQQVNIAASKATTENERFVIQEMRASIAQQAGDTALAARTFADLLASGKVPPSEQVKLIQAEVGIAYQQKNYPSAISWLQRYFKAGGNAADMRELLISAYYQNNDFANAGKLESQVVASELRARQVPKEVQLQLLARCQDNLHDTAGFENTMVLLVTYYPKPDYWANLVHNVQVAPGFSDRLTLDLDRLKLALGTITSSGDYMEMAELALQGPLPGEAKAILDQGFGAGVLGTGPEAARQNRLRALVEKTYKSELVDMPKREADAQGTHDGNPLVSLGEEYNSYGNFTKGIPLIEAGQAKDELRHPEDTKLHLALAYYKSGNKPKAIQILRTVTGKDGSAGLARLWILFINTKKA
jgi:tetratricopeptide (TPR) repeat protein